MKRTGSHDRKQVVERLLSPDIRVSRQRLNKNSGSETRILMGKGFWLSRRRRQFSLEAPPGGSGNQRMMRRSGNTATAVRDNMHEIKFYYAHSGRNVWANKGKLGRARKRAGAGVRLRYLLDAASAEWRLKKGGKSNARGGGEGALLSFCSVMNKMKEELRYRESEVNGKIFGDMGSGSQTPVHGRADFRKQGIARLYPFECMKKSIYLEAGWLTSKRRKITTKHR